MFCDRRIANTRRWFMEPPKDADMRVPDTAKDCVVFVGRLRADGTMSKDDLLGTAFIVVHRNELAVSDLSKSFLYIVTAKHVIDGLGRAECGIRINNKDGTASLLQAPHKWWTHPSDLTADVAVVPFGPPPDAPFQFSAFPTEAFATEENIEKAKIGVGDEVFITGLFAHNIGDKQNLPIVRMGNVALMAGEPIPAHDYNMDAHLIEARSIGGLSGSPALVRQTVSVALSQNIKFKDEEVIRELPPDQWPKDAIFVTGVGPFFLLGLMHGHWDIAAKQKNEILLSADRKGAVNLGIALVVPATKILETINHPELSAMRKEAHERFQKGLPPITLDRVENPSKQRTREGAEIPVPSARQFHADLWKVTRRKKSSE